MSEQDSSWQTEQQVWTEPQWTPPYQAQPVGADSWWGHWQPSGSSWSDPQWQGNYCGLVHYSLGANYMNVSAWHEHCYLKNDQSEHDSNAPVNILASPTHVILGLGCTRAMGSRRAINALIAAAPYYKLWTEILPSQGILALRTVRLPR